MTALRRVMIKALGGVAAALGLALAAPALGQDSEAPAAVTAAPPPTAETVGPSQLRDFNLQGTVTRPAERPAASGAQPVTTAPAPTGNDQAVSSEAAESAPGASDSAGRAPPPRSAVSPGARDSAIPALATVADSVTPSLPLEVTTNPAPQPGLEAETLPADPLDSAGDLFSWAWLVAILALLGGLAFIAWSRGRRQRYGDPGRMAFAGPTPDAAPEPRQFPPVRPRADPVPPSAAPWPATAPRPAPRPADDGLIVSRSFKPELTVQFLPDRVVVTETEVTLLFDLVVNNLGSAPARDVLVEGRMFTAHAAQDREIAAFFHSPVGAGDRIAAIAPLGKLSLKSAVRLPLDQIHSFEVGDRRLFVPLVGFNLLFRSNGGEEQASASFLVGRGGDQDEKLAPFRIDLGPRVFRGLATRAHSMGLQDAA